jgi:hypothetical protein
MSYVPARYKEPISVGRTDCPLAVLRSHPDFPNTLAPEFEGAWLDLNPAWPEATIQWYLSRFSPPCHSDPSDWDETKFEIREEFAGHKGYVVLVRPGPAPTGRTI